MRTYAEELNDKIVVSGEGEVTNESVSLVKYLHGCVSDLDKDSSILDLSKFRLVLNAVSGNMPSASIEYVGSDVVFDFYNGDVSYVVRKPSISGKDIYISFNGSKIGNAMVSYVSLLMGDIVMISGVKKVFGL